MFTDASGRQWRVRVVCETVFRIREETGLDLFEPDAWQALLGDVALFRHVLHLTCCPTVPPKLFARSLRGRGWRSWWTGDDTASLEAAQDDLLAAWMEFWPEPAKGESKPADPVDIEKLIWQFAGIVGVHPGPFTLRQLVMMADGCGRSAWARTSLLAAPLWNQLRDPKKRRDPFTPDDFNPYADRQKTAPLKVPFSVLREMFVPNPEDN